MYYLKLAEYEDTDTVVQLSKDLYNKSVYKNYFSFSEEVVSRNFHNSLTLPKEEFITIIVSSNEEPIGFLSGAVTKQSFSDEKMSLVLAFYSKEKVAARQLLKAYYFWAKKIGCKASMIATLKDSKSVEEYKIKELN